MAGLAQFTVPVVSADVLGALLFAAFLGFAFFARDGAPGRVFWLGAGVVATVLVALIVAAVMRAQEPERAKACSKNCVTPSGRVVGYQDGAPTGWGK